MNTKSVNTATLEKRLKRFEEAVRADEMAGSQPPEIQDEIKEEYERAKDLLRAEIGLQAE